MQEPDFYRDGILKLEPRWDRFINVLEDCAEKQLYFNGINKLHLELQ
jgi:hypothetical protein